MQGDFSGTSEVLCDTGSFYGGLSGDGNFLATGFGNAYLLNLRSNDLYRYFQPPKNGVSHEIQVCNVSITPGYDRQDEIMFLDFVLWGEPLDQGVARVLAENLRSLKNVARVSLPPFRADEQRDFEILVQVSACEGTADGDVRFAATWRILAPGGSAGTVAEGNYAASGLRWDGRDHGQLAARLSEALAGLSRDIITALPKEPAK